MTAVDLYANQIKTYDSCSNKCLAITPDDVNELTHLSRAIYVGSAGDVKITDFSGTDITFFNAPAGLIIPVRARRVFATGTTAGGLVNLV